MAKPEATPAKPTEGQFTVASSSGRIVAHVHWGANQWASKAQCTIVDLGAPQAA